MSANNPSTAPPTDVSFDGLVSQIVVSLVIVGVYLSLYEYFRHTKPSIYTPNPLFRKKPDTRAFSWVTSIWRFNVFELDGKIGADAAIFLIFLRYCCSLYFFIGFIDLVILLPVNHTGGVGLDGLDSLSISNIPSGSDRLWAHSIFTWIISIAFYVIINKMHFWYSELRHRHLLRLNDSGSIVGRTVMVLNIPEQDREHVKMMNFFTNLKIGEIQECKFYRELKSLKDVVNEYDECLRKYEGCLVNLDTQSKKKDDFLIHGSDMLQRNSIWKLLEEKPSIISEINPKYMPTTRLGSIPFIGKKVNALNYYETRLDVLKNRIAHKQEIDLLEVDTDTSPVCFTTFKEEKSAHIISQLLISNDSIAYRIRLAPEPRDILWDNLTVSWVTKRLTQLASDAASFMLTLFYLVPVAFIVSLTSIQQLSTLSPYLKNFLDKNTFVKGLLTSVVPTILTSILMSLSPLILGLFTTIEKPPTNSKWERKTMNKYFVFILFNVLLVFTLAGTALKSFQQIYNNPTSVVSILASQLPKNANFFIYYVINGYTDFAGNLLQIARLLFDLFKGLLYKTPRSLAEFYKPIAFTYYMNVPPVFLILVSSLCYSVISPIITVFAYFYFLITYMGAKNQMIYVFLPEYETGGKMWTSMFGYVLTGLFLFQLTMIGQLSLSGGYGPSACVVPLIFISFFVAYRGYSDVMKKGNVLPLVDFNREAFQDDTSEVNREKTTNVVTSIVSMTRKFKNEVLSSQGKIRATSLNRSLSNSASYKGESEELSENDVKMYYYNDLPYMKYENPVLGEKIKTLWVPPHMKVAKQYSLDWSLSRPKAASNDVTVEGEESPMSATSEDNLV